MGRCIQLAKLGAGSVAPNPMVGAVLVYQDRIIGEGYHRQYGGAHAEVNCINSVNKEDQQLMADSTLYVSLEPCAHFGKTPPCADLIIQHHIGRVVIGCRDPFEQVNGKGIEKLQQAGIEVIRNVMENECKALNKRFFCFHTNKRPYIILKWASSADGFIAAENSDDRTFISNVYSNRLVHKWRSEEASIMVGTNTALLDNPSLTTRLWTGKHATRLVIDKKLVLPESLHLFDHQVTTIVFNEERSDNLPNLEYYKYLPGNNDLEQMMQVLYEKGISSVIVEGGARLVQSFIDKKMWDEARVITNNELYLHEGLHAPALKNARKTDTRKCGTDIITAWQRIEN